MWEKVKSELKSFVDSDKKAEKFAPTHPRQEAVVGEAMTGGVTQIINQNNINNFIINNAQKIEVIEFSPAKAQLIPELKPATMMRFQENSAPSGPSMVKKIVAAKKVLPLPEPFLACSATLYVGCCPTGISKAATCSSYVYSLSEFG